MQGWLSSLSLLLVMYLMVVCYRCCCGCCYLSFNKSHSSHLLGPAARRTRSCDLSRTSRHQSATIGVGWYLSTIFLACRKSCTPLVATCKRISHWRHPALGREPSVYRAACSAVGPLPTEVVSPISTYLSQFSTASHGAAQDSNLAVEVLAAHEKQ